MTASNDSAAQGPSTDIATTTGSERPVAQVRVLLYSDDVTTRDAVRAAVGRRPARDVEVVRWHECATADAVVKMEIPELQLNWIVAILSLRHGRDIACPR